MQPVFVIGASRSGTTMFRLMLNSHSKIHIPPEAWFLGDLVASLPRSGVLSPIELEKAKKIILNNTRWKDWGCCDEKLNAAFQVLQNPTLSELIDKVFRSCSGVGEKPIWGEKSPRHSYFVSELKEVFPHAKFIHLIRDGRDVCASIFERGWYDRSFRRICEHWSTAVSSAFKGRQFSSDSYLEIRYEQLVQNTEYTLIKVCDFLEVPFEEKMLEFELRISKDIVEGEKKLHSNIGSGIKGGLIGRGNKSLTKLQKEIFNIICGNTNLSLGYSSSIGVQNSLLKIFIKTFILFDRSFHTLKTNMKYAFIQNK